MSGMTKAERTELRSLVRNQFRVLRAEVEQREIELQADVEQQIADKYHAEDERWNAAYGQIREVLSTANKEVHDVLYQHGLREKDGTEAVIVGLAREIREKPDARERANLRRLGFVKLAAKVKAATVDLDRREADMLRDLALGALESSEAQKFLTQIPSVGELVPASRLAELEASLEQDDH